MRNVLRALGLILALIPGLAAAQTFPTVPDHTVLGRIGTGSSSGPSQAIPFAILTTQLMAALNGAGSIYTGISGDCTANSLGIITCTATNGVLFGSIATQNASSVAITGGSITGVAITGGSITSLPNPINVSDAATKGYVDGSSSGLIILALTSYATAAVLPNSPTYSNGALGVGATLTAGSNSTLTVDGTVAALNSVVLVNNQAAPAQNGIYTLTTAGSGSVPWVLTRATYFNQASNMLKGSYTFITGGSANINSSWVMAATTTTVGTTAVSFNQFNQANGVASLCGLSGSITATQATACLNLFTSSLRGLVPASSGGTSNFLRADGTWNSPLAGGQNLLPNTQWQIFASLAYITMMNSGGTGSQTPVFVSSFTTGSNLTTFTASNTQQLKAGDIIYFNGGSNLTYASMRVISVTPNTSFTAYLPGQLIPTSSSAVTATPITVGDAAGTSPWGPNNWTKTSTLLLWRDAFAANVQSGSYFSLGLRKGAGTTESLIFPVPISDVQRFQGRTVVFGAWVLSRGTVGNGNFQLCIIAACSTVTAGTNAYQWVETTTTISSSASSVTFSLATEGSSGDIYYVSQPMLSYGSALGTGNYIQNKGEVVQFDNHINAPVLTPFSGTLPTSAWPGTSTDFGWEWDIEALTNGQIARTVTWVYSQAEYTSPHVGSNIQEATCMCSPGAIFGTENWAVGSNITSSVSGNWPIDHTGLYIAGQPGYFALFGGISGNTITNLTVDFSAATLN